MATLGRPSIFTEELVDIICDRLISGESLRTICSSEEMPTSSTIYKWLIEKPLFSERYTRARESQMEAMAEEILEIADDTSNDTELDEDGTARQNSEWINRSRLRVDTRKWLMSKLAPKKYGERIQQDISGEVTLKAVLVPVLPTERKPDPLPAFEPKLLESGEE